MRSLEYRERRVTRSGTDQNTGVYALVDRSRKPHRFGNQLPEQIERTLVRLKREKPHWGAPKIRELLIRRFPNLRAPAVSTVHAVLDRNGLVNCRKRRRPRAQGTPLSSSQNPNDLWSAELDLKFGPISLTISSVSITLENDDNWKSRKLRSFLPPLTFCCNRRGSMPSRGSTMTRDRMRLSP